MKKNIGKRQAYAHFFFSPKDEGEGPNGIYSFNYDKEPDNDLCTLYKECLTYTLEDFKKKYPIAEMDFLWDWDGQPMRRKVSPMYVKFDSTRLSPVGDRFEYNGDIVLEHRAPHLTDLIPPNTTITGNLDLSSNDVCRALPEGLIVKGWCNLSHSNVEALPEGLTVGGNLNLRHATSIKNLTKGLAVGGALNLWATNVTQFPEDMMAKRLEGLWDYNITNYPVVSLPSYNPRICFAYLDLKDKRLIHMDCFKGTKEEAIQYAAEQPEDVEEDLLFLIESCYSMWDFENKCMRIPWERTSIGDRQVYVHCFFNTKDDEWPVEGINIYNFNKEPDTDLVEKCECYVTYRWEEFKKKYPHTAIEQTWDWEGQPFQV